MSHVRRAVALAVLFAFGVVGIAAAQPTPEEQLRAALAELERALQKQKQKQKEPPKPVEKLPMAQPTKGGLPTGAVARLGQTRLRHADKPTCVVFSPDGKTFITGAGSEDSSIRVWSVATGEQLNILQKPGLGVSALKLTHGGKQLAVQFGTDNLVRFLDAETLRETPTTPFVARNHFAFSTDGTLAITSNLDGSAVITEVDSELPKLELTGADQFDFQPDGKAVAVGDTKGNVAIYRVTGGKKTLAVKHDGPIVGVAYSPDGKRLAVGSRDPDVVRVYEPAKDKEKPVAEITGFNLPKSWVGNDALVLGNGTEAGVYNLAKKEWTGRVKGIAGEFAVSPDGTKLAATGSGLRIRLYDLTTGKQMHAENDSFPDPSLLVGSADGKTLFLLTTDTAYLWPVGAESAKPAGTLPGRAVAAQAAGDKLIVATPDAVVLYDKFDPSKPLPEKPTHTFKDSAGARAVAVSANGTRVAWAMKDGKVLVTDPADKTGRRTLPMDSTTVLALGFNPAGDRLGTLARDPNLRVWDVSDEREQPKELWKARVQRGLKGVVAFSPDGKHVSAISTTQLIVFEVNQKDPESVEPLHKFERYTDQGALQHGSFSPDGRYLIVGSIGAGGRVEVWELATRGLVRAFTTGYGGTSRMCVFPDGTRAASAGAEEAVTVWDLTFRSSKAAPKAEELTAAWADLESAESGVAYPAIKALAAGKNKGTEVMARGTKEMLETQRKIKDWVDDLGSETFSIREIASRELVAQGARALPAVTAASMSDDPEIRDRATEVLKKITALGASVPAHGLGGDSLRLVRAVQALEEIGTPEAKSLLESIVMIGGKPADEAKAALARLKKK